MIITLSNSWLLSETKTIKKKYTHLEDVKSSWKMPSLACNCGSKTESMKLNNQEFHYAQQKIQFISHKVNKVNYDKLK